MLTVRWRDPFRPLAEVRVTDQRLTATVRNGRFLLDLIAMTILSAILIVKIGVTLFAVALPFLLLSKENLDERLEMTAESSSLYRLYGVAVFALLLNVENACTAKKSKGIENSIRGKSA